MIGSRPALFPVWHLAGWTMRHFTWVGSLVCCTRIAASRRRRETLPQLA
jgi:hypothetical protein